MATAHASRLVVWASVTFLVLAGPTWAGLFQEEPPVPAAIAFGSDLSSAFAAARQTGRPIVVVFGAVW